MECYHCYTIFIFYSYPLCLVYVETYLAFLYSNLLGRYVTSKYTKIMNDIVGKISLSTFALDLCSSIYYAKSSHMGSGIVFQEAYRILTDNDEGNEVSVAQETQHRKKVVMGSSGAMGGINGILGGILYGFTQYFAIPILQHLCHGTFLISNLAGIVFLKSNVGHTLDLGCFLAGFGLGYLMPRLLTISNKLVFKK